MVLADYIEVGEWTMIEHLPSRTSVRIGHLPGDVNGDRITTPLDDVLELMASIRGIARPRELWSVDLDHSGQLSPSDILTLLNLLNGAGELESYINRTLPDLPCR